MGANSQYDSHQKQDNGHLRNGESGSSVDQDQDREKQRRELADRFQNVYNSHQKINSQSGQDSSGGDDEGQHQDIESGEIARNNNFTATQPDNANGYLPADHEQSSGDEPEPRDQDQLDPYDGIEFPENI